MTKYKSNIKTRYIHFIYITKSNLALFTKKKQNNFSMGQRKILMDVEKLCGF